MIVSKRPALGEGLKKLIEHKLFCTLATTSYEETDAEFMVELEPGIVIFDRRDIRSKSFDYLFQSQEQLFRIALIRWKDYNIAVYSCKVVQGLTLENLMEFIISESEVKLHGI